MHTPNDASPKHSRRSRGYRRSELVRSPGPVVASRICAGRSYGPLTRNEPWALVRATVQPDELAILKPARASVEACPRDAPESPSAEASAGSEPESNAPEHAPNA